MTLNDTARRSAGVGGTFLPAAPAQRLLRQQAAKQFGDLSALADILRLDRSAVPRAGSGTPAPRHSRPHRGLPGPAPERAVAGVVPDRRGGRPMTATPADAGPVLTVEEAAAYLRISRGLAFAAVRDGSLPSVHIGRRILIPRRQLEALLDGATTEA